MCGRYGKKLSRGSSGKGKDDSKQVRFGNDNRNLSSY